MRLLANKGVFGLIVILALAVPVASVLFYINNNIESNHTEVEVITINASNLNPMLVAMEPNQWVKVSSPWVPTWSRQTHSGMSYNSSTGNLLLFGSDSHGTNWNNTVIEFNPAKESWNVHYAKSPKLDYQLDDDNYTIVLTDNQLRPWAMHTFDNIVFDPKNNVLFVTATPNHNPIGKTFNNKIYPMWRYDLGTQAWNIFTNNDKPMPVFFAGGTEYDPDRDTIVAYKSGIWELGPERKSWTKATDEFHHRKYFNLEYDNKNKSFFVFGDSSLNGEVWSYKAGGEAGEKGQWEKHEPMGDIPPPSRHFPVAYDTRNNVFLMVRHKSTHSVDPNQTQDNLTAFANSYIYDPSLSQFTKLPDANISIEKINYMMIYDNKHEVFLLITGNAESPATVWALKLEI